MAETEVHNNQQISRLYDRDRILTPIAWSLTIIALALYQSDIANLPILTESQYEIATPITVLLTLIAIGSWASNKINISSELRTTKSQKRKEDQKE